MAIREVLTWPDPRLKTIAQPAGPLSDALRQLCEDLLETMYEQGGVGLAATQIGVPQRVVVVDCGQRSEEGLRTPRVLIDPEIVERRGEITWMEGCLSVPGVVAEVERSQWIAVEYMGIDGRRQRMEAEDLEAVCVQHELDHLEGVLYIDRLSDLQRRATLLDYEEARARGLEVLI